MSKTAELSYCVSRRILFGSDIADDLYLQYYTDNLFPYSEEGKKAAEAFEKEVRSRDFFEEHGFPKGTKSYVDNITEFGIDFQSAEDCVQYGFTEEEVNEICRALYERGWGSATNHCCIKTVALVDGAYMVATPLLKKQ